MTVTCPSCRTTYRVPAPHRRRRRPVFECATCGHVFEPTPSEPDWDDDEPWVMDDEDARERAALYDADPDEDVAPDTDGEMDVDAGESEEEPFEAEEDEPVEPPRRRAKSRGRRTPRDEAASGSPARFAVRSLLAVALFYSVVGIYVTTFPESSRAAMKRIPLVGAHLARVPLGPAQMGLTDVAARFEPLAGGADDGVALVVVATVTNHSEVTAERVELVIDLQGGEMRSERRRCTGAVLDVSPFKRSELELMASYGGSRLAQIAPGASVTCQSIFLDPPPGVRSVAVRVGTAQGR
jgi:predicted Zn finger-like uncharacterized protein